MKCISQIEVDDMMRQPLEPGVHLGGDSGTSANLEHLLSCALRPVKGENTDRISATHALISQRPSKSNVLSSYLYADDHKILGVTAT